MNNIIPLRNTIFVLPDEVVDRTKSGIILTDYSKKRSSSGIILAVGLQVKDFKKGDRIIYGDFSGQRQIINYNGKEVEIFMMTENDILALIE
mgnify:FL=1